MFLPPSQPYYLLILRSNTFHLSTSVHFVRCPLGVMYLTLKARLPRGEFVMSSVLEPSNTLWYSALSPPPTHDLSSCPADLRQARA